MSYRNLPAAVPDSTARRLVALLKNVLPCLVPLLVVGCVAIPAGTRELDREELGRETASRTELKSLDIVPSLDERRGAVSLRFDGEYEVTEYDNVRESITRSRRSLVLGLFPYVGAGAWGDRNVEPLPEMETEFGNAFQAMVLPLGWALFTPPCIILEFWHDWDSLAANAPPAPLFLVGWAKTARHETAESSRRTQPRTRRRTRPVGNTRASVTLPGTDFVLTRNADARGRLSIDLADLPVLPEDAAKVEIEATAEDTRAGPVSVALPADLMRRHFARRLWEGRTRPDKIWLHDREVDFGRQRTDLMPSARPVVAVEGQPAERPDVLKLTATVTNASRGTLYRLIGKTECPQDSRLSDYYFIFGKVNPGETVRRTVELPLTGLDPTGRYDIEIAWKEGNRFEPEPTRIAVHGPSLDWPALAWTYEVIDDETRSETAVGNADGVIQRTWS